MRPRTGTRCISDRRRCCCGGARRRRAVVSIPPDTGDSGVRARRIYRPHRPSARPEADRQSRTAGHRGQPPERGRHHGRGHGQGCAPGRAHAAFQIVGAAAAAVHDAGAQSYPSRPIRAIVGFVPGGSTDLIARQLAQKLTDSLGQPVIVDNRPSGAGIMAAVMAKDAPPDGHTLYFGTISALATHPATHAKLPYDPLRDYAPITLTLSNPYFVAVHPGVPAGSVKEFIALARTKPGQL